MTAREQHIARLMGQIPLERFGKVWDDLTPEQQRWCETEADRRAELAEIIMPFAMTAGERRAA